MEVKKSICFIFQVVPRSLAPNRNLSTVQNDYNSFGVPVSEDVYKNRIGSLSSIKKTIERDAVGESIFGGKRKLLTRSMIDYRHPLDRLSGNVKILMDQSITPFVRIDSVWKRYVFCIRPKKKIWLISCYPTDHVD